MASARQRKQRAREILQYKSTIYSGSMMWRIRYNKYPFMRVYMHTISSMETVLKDIGFCVFRLALLWNVSEDTIKVSSDMFNYQNKIKN